MDGMSKPAGYTAELAALEDAIQKSKRWMEAAASFTEGLQIETTIRNRVAVSLFHLCVEHHQGIHTLVDMGLVGSAFALVRPQFEAYIRGAWFAVCATDDGITKFLQDNEPPKIGVMIKSLEEKEAYTGGSLSRMKKEVWDNLCGFTHGGSIQVKARNTKDEIKLNYRLPHISGMLTSSVLLSYLACVGMSAVKNDTPLANKMRGAHQEIYGATV